MKTWRSLITACISVLALSASLAGCAGGDASSFVASSRSFMAKNDYRSAIIELKNALQRDPDSGDARLLLASSLLEVGDPVGAEVEVRKAIALHVPDDKSYPVLAWVLVGRRDYSKLASELGERKFEEAAARADVQAAFATAALAQGDTRKAKELADAALKDQPTSVRVLIIETDIAARQGDAKAARQFIDAALKSAPTNLAVLLMKSNLEIAEGKFDAARAVLGEALVAHPDSPATRYALFELAIRNHKLGDAREQVTALKKIAPKDLRTHYADALLALGENDRARAKEAIQFVVRGRPITRLHLCCRRPSICNRAISVLPRRHCEEF
jgi:Tfp pilus assembly protein PilF